MLYDHASDTFVYKTREEHATDLARLREEQDAKLKAVEDEARRSKELLTGKSGGRGIHPAGVGGGATGPRAALPLSVLTVYDDVPMHNRPLALASHILRNTERQSSSRLVDVHPDDFNAL